LIPRASKEEEKSVDMEGIDRRALMEAEALYLTDK